MRSTPISRFRALTAANIVFITPKIPPIDITPVTNKIATMNCLLVSLSRSKYSVSGVA